MQQNEWNKNIEKPTSGKKEWTWRNRGWKVQAEMLNVDGKGRGFYEPWGEMYWKKREASTKPVNGVLQLY